MRVRVRYAKQGRIRWISAIDLGRVWERALRRADLPIAYSEGFTPHPKVSFPDALPLGYASTGEYAELTFAGPIALQPAIAALNAAFPEGMDVLTAVEVAEGAPRLARALRASTWDLQYPSSCATALAAAAPALLAADALPVERDRKGEVTTHDLRPALHQVSVADAIVRVTVVHTEPPMRPSEVHTALTTLAASSGPLAEPALVTRVAQGEPTPDGLIEALSGELIPPLSTDLQKATTP